MTVSADCLLSRAAPNQQCEEAGAVLALSAAQVGAAAAPLLRAHSVLGLPTLRSCRTESSATLFKATSDLTKVTQRVSGRAKSKVSFCLAQGLKAQLAPPYQRRCSKFPCCKGRNAMLLCLRIKFFRTTVFAGMITTLVDMFLSAPINDGQMSSA